MSLREVLNETSLSRIVRHNERHDCGAMTAFRVAPDCGLGTPYSKSDNKKRNMSLKAKLMARGYSVTAVKGKYPEGGKQVTEDSYFVVDVDDSGKLRDDMFKFGEMFDQDSVLIMPKGAIVDEAVAFLLGTNKCENNWLGYKKTEKFKGARIGVGSPIYTTFVNGRPFILEDECHPVQPPSPGKGQWYANILAEKNWQDIEVEE